MASQNGFDLTCQKKKKKTTDCLNVWELAGLYTIKCKYETLEVVLKHNLFSVIFYALILLCSLWVLNQGRAC